MTTQQRDKASVIPPAAESPQAASKRVSVTFGPSTYAALVELAQVAGSIPEALRRAIALAKWFSDVRKEGAHILIERNGQIRELVQI